MATGYSGKAAYEKLGMKSGLKALIMHEPSAYLPLVGVPEGVKMALIPAVADLDYVHIFATARLELARELPRLRQLLQPAGMIWVSWPKKASGVPTDLTEDVIRELALGNALVDVKVCAVDATWSGLKLVIRRRDRPKSLQ